MILKTSLPQVSFKKSRFYLSASCRWFAVKIIRGYQLFISPMIGPRCRFTPSCSHYAIEAIQNHGFIAGTILSGKRLARCHPYCDGGWDPVPKSNMINKLSLFRFADEDGSNDEQFKRGGPLHEPVNK